MNRSEAKRSVIDAGHQLVSEGLIVRTWGNISCRVDGDIFAITPSGMGYDRLTEEDIVLVDCRTLAHDQGKKPSGETGIHAAVYRLRPEINFVIHTHQNAASALSVAGAGQLCPTPEEARILGGVVPSAAYGLPCSAPLCQAVTTVLETTDCETLFMVRHGVLAMGRHRAEAFQRSAVLERVCERSLHREPAFPVPSFDPAPLMAAIQAADPSLSSFRFTRDPSVVRMSESGDPLIPMLDDFAQLIGVDVLCVDPADVPVQAAKALLGRNAVLIRGRGGLCAAGCPGDAEAVELLLQKECMTQRHARFLGGAEPLPLDDRQTMRDIYVNRYSKLK